jgi:hypothetical protein
MPAAQATEIAQIRLDMTEGQLTAGAPAQQAPKPPHVSSLRRSGSVATGQGIMQKCRGIQIAPPAPMHRYQRLGLPLAAALVLTGCNFFPSSGTRVVQIRCVKDTGLDKDKRCLKPDSLSSEIEIRVNKVTRQVHVSFVNSRGQW